MGQEEDIDVDGKFEEILDTELGRLLAGQASIDECCAAHPDVAGELRPLLEVARSGQRALEVDVPSEIRESTHEKILSQAGGKLTRRRGSGKFWAQTGISRLWLRPVVLGMGLLLLAFAGTAIAASKAAPDNVLYPLKQDLESARTDLAIQDIDQAQVENGHANARLDELLAMVADGKYEYINSLLAHYDSSIAAATGHADAAAAGGEDASGVYDQIRLTRERHNEVLAVILTMLPGDRGQALRELLGMPNEGTNPGMSGTNAGGNGQPQTGGSGQMNNAGDTEGSDRGTGENSGQDEGGSGDSQKNHNDSDRDDNSSRSDSIRGNEGGSNDEKSGSSDDQTYRDMYNHDGHHSGT